MLNLLTNRQDILNDILDEVKLFYPLLDKDIDIYHTFVRQDDTIINNFTINDKDFSFIDVLPHTDDRLVYHRLENRGVKLSVYKALNEFSGESKPYGSLTGIRPTKIVYDMIRDGEKDPCKALQDNFCVSEKKAKLITDIVNYQSSIKYNENDYNLYIHIPFCVSKCSYCSFSTQLVSHVKDLIPTYVKLLKKEIVESLDLLASQGKNIYSIYIGGGTPTALNESELEDLLSIIPNFNCEFTVEAGRPDTITKEKLDILKNHNVTRICVNPQSFNEKTLALIGRSHTIKQFYDAYSWAKGKFDINIDLIAGLNGENLDDFVLSVNKALELCPENLTVHTLSKKNGSILKNTQIDYTNNQINQMVDYSFNEITSKGYLPYYMYRQKQMLGNLENIGYTLKDKMCVNNITTMEEKLSVMACGAGSISKRLFPNGRIERLANVRDTALYISQFDERLKKKLDFFQ